MLSEIKMDFLSDSKNLHLFPKSHLGINRNEILEIKQVFRIRINKRFTFKIKSQTQKKRLIEL